MTFAYTPLDIQEVYATDGPLCGCYLGVVTSKQGGEAWEAKRWDRFLGTFDSKREAAEALAKLALQEVRK